MDTDTQIMVAEIITGSLMVLMLGYLYIRMAFDFKKFKTNKEVYDKWNG